MIISSPETIPEFSEDFYSKDFNFCRMGSGSIGGKAGGLFFIQDEICNLAKENKNTTIEISYPKTIVICTDYFDQFLKENDLFQVAHSNTSDNYIAHDFQRANLPKQLVKELKIFYQYTRTPLAIRSSSISEDVSDRPFAGVFNTKMIPNNHESDEDRFNKLLEAIKFVYASTFFKRAKDYYLAIGNEIKDEKMAIIIQECFGNRYGELYYPEISGVAKSHNFYPTGQLKPSDRVVNLAFGLGKTIVDGGIAWIYSPEAPKAPAPFNTTKELLINTQTKFWAINMSQHPEYNPSSETEFMVNEDIIDADDDGALEIIASTYDTVSDRIVMGTSFEGPRIIDFAPILKLEMIRVNESIRNLIIACEKKYKTPVELEFLMKFDKKKNNVAKLILLQVRKMSLSSEQVDIQENELSDGNNLLASNTVHGNGIIDDIVDVVYVRPETFNIKYSQQIATELEAINSDFIKDKKNYLLMGFGRWGSSDPWLGIPVKWAQVSQAKSIVETTQPGMFIEMSQGTHFFHNITGSHVSYFSVEYFDKIKIDWDWLNHQPVESETKFIKHVKLSTPLLIKVDGRQQRGIIQKQIIDSEVEKKDIIDKEARRKELNCIYDIEKHLSKKHLSIEATLDGICQSLKEAWHHQSFCEVEIKYKTFFTKTKSYKKTDWSLTVTLDIFGKEQGYISLCYLKKFPQVDIGPFYNEEIKLLESVGDMLSDYLETFEEEIVKEKKGRKKNWRVVLEMISKTDGKLQMLVTKKMLYQLCLSNNKEAQDFLGQFDKDIDEKSNESYGDTNTPLRKKKLVATEIMRDRIFNLASSTYTDKEIIGFLEKWSEQHNANFLVEVLSDYQSSLSDIINAISRYNHIYDTKDLPDSTKRQLLVSLIGRFLTNDSEYVKIAKNFYELDDFLEILHNVVTPIRSHGTIGGKGAGMFLAHKILEKKCKGESVDGMFKIPKTWYVSTDTFESFIRYNNLGDLYEQKYKNIDQIRQEHSQLIHVFKNAPFPQDIINGLRRALEDLGETPLVIRSSSLLEDSFKASFAGKYKSLFISNIGTIEERLEELMDAISEIYASIFAPDPISYRAERNLLDVKETMGIMIQKVVGKRAGDYYLPSYAGVCFCNNEFRWSKRIKKDDGLIRIVPGLGTRAVDRVSDDYPILIAPGQPGLRVNISVDEMCRYSPKKIDLINLKTGEFETHDVYKILKELGYDYPNMKQVISIYDRTRVYRPVGLDLDIEDKELLVTFEGLFSTTSFISKIKERMDYLKSVFQFPVDVEFASDGENIYLLQCRPQINSQDNQPVPIPQDIPAELTIFTANKYISNGLIPDITHVVYVDPDEYSKVEKVDDLIRVGEIVGHLNKILPKKKFILIGPGRWGSRGDIKMGVRTSYSDLNNTSVLIEVARKKGNYTPELSFGTHFFQDLVEANIRYIPLYPDESDVSFNYDFLKNSYNLLSQLLPDYSDLSKVVNVVDIGKITDGKVLRILMNSDLDQALGFLTQSGSYINYNELHPELEVKENSLQNFKESENWNWRFYIAKEIAAQMDQKRFGVIDLYFIRNEENETTKPESDIDLLVHFRGNNKQKIDLELWLEGWSRCLGIMNFLYTGYRREKLLDVKIVTDEHIEEKKKIAIKVDEIEDPSFLIKKGKLKD